MAARKALLQRLWRRVHPDLLHTRPHAARVNEASMQELRALLDRADPPASSPTLRLHFFVREGEREESLREISHEWRPPPAARRKAESLTDLWTKSVDRCLAVLVNKVEQPAVCPKLEDRAAEKERASAPHPLSAGLQPDKHRYNAIVRVAAQSADRSINGASKATSHSSHEAEEFVQPPCFNNQIALDDKLLFFYELTGDEQVGR